MLKRAWLGGEHLTYLVVAMKQKKQREDEGERFALPGRAPVAHRFWPGSRLTSHLGFKFIRTSLIISSSKNPTLNTPDSLGTSQIYTIAPVNTR